MLFDGLKAQCFVINLHNNVTGAQVRMMNIVPGVLYTFIFRQQGSFTFEWPSLCRNTAPVDPEPGSTTVENFIGNTDGHMDADITGTWHKPS